MILRIKSSHPFSIIQFNAGFIWLSKKIDFDFIDFWTNLHLTSIFKRNETDFIVLAFVEKMIKNIYSYVSKVEAADK